MRSKIPCSARRKPPREPKNFRGSSIGVAFRRLNSRAENPLVFVGSDCKLIIYNNHCRPSRKDTASGPTSGEVPPWPRRLFCFFAISYRLPGEFPNRPQMPTVQARSQLHRFRIMTSINAAPQSCPADADHVQYVPLGYQSIVRHVGQLGGREMVGLVLFGGGHACSS